MKPLALVDLDSTLADFDGSMRELLAPLMSPDEPPEWMESSFEDGIPAMKARRRLVKKIPGFWRNLKRYEPGFEIVEELRFLDFDLHILTKAPSHNSDAWSEKIEWCRQHIPGVPVTISQDKSLVYGRVLVDDYPDYFMPWLNHRPRGLVIAPAHPWNDGVEHDRVYRYVGHRQPLRELLQEVKDRIKSE